MEEMTEYDKPEKCDFCQQPFTAERYPIPEEAGEWTCRECLTRWQKAEKAREG